MQLRYIFPMFFALLLSLSACITFTNCSDNKPTQPPDTLKPLDTTSHEFVWKVDTVSISTYFEGLVINGTSATDVFIAGYSTDAERKCFRWDGVRWNAFNLSPYIAGRIEGVCILDPNYILFVGEGPGVIGYTGLMALENGVLKSLPLAKGRNKRTCAFIASKNEVYLGGVDGIQMYNGNNWIWILDKTDQIIDNNGSQFTAIDIFKHKDGVLEFTSQNKQINSSTKYTLWSKTVERPVPVDSFLFSEQGMDKIRFGYYFRQSGNAVLSCSKGGTYERVNTSWTKIHTQAGSILTGSKNNLYVTSWDNVMHFNGASWRNLLPSIKSAYPNLDIQIIYSIFYVDSTIFVSVRSHDNTVVVRGQQK